MRYKQYISRTVTYLSLINSGMLLFLFLNTIKGTRDLGIDLDKYFMVIFATGIFCLAFLGWIDITFIKGVQEENEYIFVFRQEVL